MVQKKFSNIYKHLYLLFFLLLLLFLFSYSIITIPIHSDDGNILKEVIYFKNKGFDRGYNTLVPIIPVVLYSILTAYNIPLLLLSCISTVFFLISIFLLIKLFFGYRYPIFLIFLFPIIFERSAVLPPYSLFMFLFTLSLYLFVKATQIKKETSIVHRNQEQEYDNVFSYKKLYIFSALFLSLAIYSFTISLVLSIIPFIYLICVNLEFRTKLKIFIKYYSCLFLLLLPWLYWHFSVGGLKYFYYSPFNWYTVKALPLVNRYFWGYGSIAYPDLLRLYFNQFIPNILLIPCLVFIIVGLFNYKKFKTPIKLSVLWLIFYLPLLAFLGVAAFPRYFFPLVVPLTLISSAGLVALRNHYKRSLHFALVALILIFGILFNNTAYFSNRQIANSLRPSSSFLDAKEFNSIIDDNKNIFCRHYGFQYIFSNNYFVTQVDMNEEEALKLISWSSEDDVKEILKKYNIGWVMLYNNEKKWEHDYYVWVNILYGKEPIHYKKIKDSNLFEEIKQGKVYSLYKFVDSQNE